MTRLTPPPSEIVRLNHLDSSLSAPPPDDVKVSCVKTRYVTPDGSIDPDAVKVVRRLNRFGYEAYLVGGSIRDILFGKRPKDFDIATSALPSEVRRLFGNCRLIGRRFRLAHLLFKHGKVIEVATFRRGATEEDDVEGRHAAENLFGGPADDAIRRDFTINALMYDVTRKEIYDYVGGLKDIDGRVLRTIGKPARRFKEDPARIIRAVKFCVRLNLSVDEEFKSSMKKYAPNIVECAPARLVEEVLKLLRSGDSSRCFDMLLETTVLRQLLPELVRRAEKMKSSDSYWPLLKRVDESLSKGNHLSDATMLCALVFPFISHVFDEGGDVVPKLESEFKDIFVPLKFTKRQLARVRQVLIAQRRLDRQPKSRKICQILEREYAADALDFKEIMAETPEDRALLAAWLTAFAKRRRYPKRSSRPRRPRKPRIKKSEATT